MISFLKPMGCVILGALALYACAEQQTDRTHRAGVAEQMGTLCDTPLSGKPWARTELFFGLAKSDGTMVTEREFQAFMDREVTPRFPDGLTLLVGLGQFREANGIITREPSRLLVLLYPLGKSRSEASIEEIRQSYQRAFGQSSVLRADSRSCVSF